MVEHGRARSAATRSRAGGRPASLRAAPTPSRTRSRDGSRGRPADRDPAPARAHESWGHLDLPAGHRQRRDYRRRPRPTRADDPGRRVATPLTFPSSSIAAVAGRCAGAAAPASTRKRARSLGPMPQVRSRGLWLALTGAAPFSFRRLQGGDPLVRGAEAIRAAAFVDERLSARDVAAIERAADNLGCAPFFAPVERTIR